MADNPTPSISRSKLFLQRVNSWLSTQNNNRKSNIWHSIHKWNYDHHLVKNLLKITNKTLKGLNKYHVFKKDYIYLLVGLGLGHLASQLQNNWDKVQNLQFQPAVTNLIIDKALKNEEIRLKLQEAVNDNILKNQDIQTNLHFILINKVLSPQKQKINELAKIGLLTVLKSDEVFKLAEAQTVKAIQKNQGLIAREAFNFLNSQQMLKIITSQVAPLIKGQMVQMTVSKQVKQFVASQLHNEENHEKAYHFMRQKIV